MTPTTSRRLLILALLTFMPARADAEGNALFGPYSMTREATGTSWQPEASPMEGRHYMAGPWMFMVHGFADAAYTWQGGLRGDRMAFGPNMAMVMGERSLGRGTLGVRAMLTLEPLMGPAGYPLLLQTGESADGRNSLIDRQHPHDAFMELAVSWQHPLGRRSSVFAYAGLPAEPALGPPAFMHRGSAGANPLAPISHHWIDATHLTYGVVTLGAVAGPFKLDASAFNGREPDEKRWDIERPQLDSYSARLTWNPSRDWSLQVSAGHLRHPERLHPTINVDRVTASVSWTRGSADRRSAVTLVWGRNARDTLQAFCAGFSARCESLPEYLPRRITDAFLAEAALTRGRSHAFARVEQVDKDELFPNWHPNHPRVFPVWSLSLGGSREVARRSGIGLALGAVGTLNRLPPFMDLIYGRSPKSVTVFARFTLE